MTERPANQRKSSGAPPCAVAAASLLQARDLAGIVDRHHAGGRLPDGLETRADAEPRSDHSDDEPATIGRQANDDHPRMTQMSMV